MKQSSITTGLGCGTIIFVLIISATIGAFCWPYTINTWLHYFGKPVGIVWWQGALIGFCPWIGQASIPAAVVTFILMFFLQ